MRPPTQTVGAKWHTGPVLPCLLSAVYCLLILAVPTSAQGPQYTDLFAGHINQTWTAPCGNPGDTTAQIQAALATLQ